LFLRGREHESTIWQRFHSVRDGFSVGRVDGIVEVIVRTNADRAVDLFLALAEELPPAVSVAVHDVRTNAQWSGTQLALPDVTNAMARLKLSLATFAGAEVCIFTGDEQLTLTPSLALYAHSVNDRWIFMLRGHGLVQRATLPRRSWRLSHDAFPPAPEASQALLQAAGRLALTPS